MKVFALCSGYFKLDGGAMFGHIPKAIWEKLNPPDSKNLCTWALRLLLIEHNDLLILVDTGLYNSKESKFVEYYEPRLNDISKLLSILGYSVQDISHVIISHLHFDHCGGSVINGEPVFPNAKYIFTRRQYFTASFANPKEKGSFISETFQPLKEKNLVHFIEGNGYCPNYLPDIDLFIFDGHTTGMIAPLINTGKTMIFYPSDLIPSSYHLPIGYHMSYDVRPLLLMEEKKIVLDRSLSENWIICFEHDPTIPACIIYHDGKKHKPKEIVGDKINENIWQIY